MALKHSKTATAGQNPGDATQVGGDDWNADHVVDGDGITITMSTSTPTTPASGKGVLYGMDNGSSAMPAYLGADGRSYAFQPFLGSRRTLLWMPAAGITSATAYMLGGFANILGTVTTRTITNTNMFTMMPRQGAVTSTTSSQRAGPYFGSSVFYRANGFRATFRFGISDASFVSGANTFVGFSPTSSILSGSTDPDASTNMVGMGNNAADTTMQLYYNDGSGTASKVDLGADFPANTTNTDVYELSIYCAPSDSKIGVRIVRLNTGHVFTTTLTTDIPVTTQGMIPVMIRGNMTIAAAVGIDSMILHVESEI